MTDDRVETALAAFIDHLDGGGPEPSLDDLSPENRAEAKRLFDVLKAGRGIDSRLSRPSLADLLAGTEFQDWISPDSNSEPDPVDEPLSVDAITNEVLAALGPGTTPILDAAAQTEGIRSNALIVVRGHRLRFQFRGDLTSADELAQLDPIVAAGAVFGRFPETAALILVLSDTEHTSVAIGPYDIDIYFGSPDGKLHKPRIVGTPLPLGDTLIRCLSEIAADLSPTFDPPPVGAVDVAEIATAAAGNACGAIAKAGSQARTPSKRDAWTSIGDVEARQIAQLTTDVAGGIVSPEDLAERLEEAAQAA